MDGPRSALYLRMCIRQIVLEPSTELHPRTSGLVGELSWSFFRSIEKIHIYTECRLY